MARGHSYHEFLLLLRQATPEVAQLSIDRDHHLFQIFFQLQANGFLHEVHVNYRRVNYELYRLQVEWQLNLDSDLFFIQASAAIECKLM